MSNIFVEFQEQIEAVKARHEKGEIDKAERDKTLRGMQLKDDETGEVWMLSATGDWFRKAKRNKEWARDYPDALIDPDELPPIAEMSMAQLFYAVRRCTRCRLHESRNRAVPGEGPVPSDIMLIGEGPGFNEDKQGRPFVGAAGKFLEELLGNIGYKRSDVFITNIVKCRPPSNRDPKTDEIEACSDYLERQIELVDPKVIVTLGRHSMYRYFPGASITKIHGQPKRVGNRLVVPMFHPAAALHQPRWKPLITEDFENLPKFIAEAEKFAAEDPDPDDAEQLSMF